jgi:transposase
MEVRVPPAAVERAMQVREVIARAMSGEITWLQAADICRMSPRSMRRWKARYEARGYDGLWDRRRRSPSPRQAPLAEVERILRLYRERYLDFNVRHFHEIAAREHKVELSYSYVKAALQKAGLVRKKRPRGKHRKRREPRASFGEMLHIDGSKHRWLALVPEEQQTLIAIADDATSELLYAQLWPEETTRAVLAALREVLVAQGIPQSLYSDRASWAVFTPKAGGPVDRSKPTHVARVLAKLGIEQIVAYSPQARGRSERLNRTLQDRLVNELRLHGVRTVEQANRYLRQTYIPRHNANFRRMPKDPESAFVACGNVDLEQIVCLEEPRVVAKDNTVVFYKLSLQIDKQPGRRSCERAKVQVREHLDGTHSVWLGPKRLGLYDAQGRPLPLHNGKKTKQVQTQAPSKAA